MSGNARLADGVEALGALLLQALGREFQQQVQLFLDGEAWRSIQVRSPEGRKIFDVAGGGQLKNLGLTELFWESEEPSFDEMPLEEFLALFPEGEYTFSGKTVEARQETFRKIQTRLYELRGIIQIGDVGIAQAARSNVKGFTPFRFPRLYDV